MEKNKKIKLIIFPGNFLPHIGGLETHVNEFCKYLSKDKKYDITIFTPNVLNSKEKEIIHNNVKVIRYPAFFLVQNWPFPKFWHIKFWKFYISLYKKKYDIVMTRTMFFTNSTLGMFFAKFRFKRLKLIHVEHGSDYSKLDSKFKLFFNKLYMRIFGNLILTLSDKIVVVSSASKQFLENSFIVGKKEISVIRRGFDFKKLKNVEVNSNLKSKYKNKKIISFVGRLIDGKGVQDVLKALKDIDKNYVFLIMGDGQYRDKLEDLVRKYNLVDRVVFMGRISHDEVISILKISDIFVNPSHTEGLPTAVLDAFFSGCMIVATNVGGTFEILNRHWDSNRYKLVEMRNSVQIRKAILDLFKIKSKLDTKLYNEIKTKFDWENHAEEYGKILSEVMLE